MFAGILFHGQPQPLSEGIPDCFRDLNLDQLFGPIVRSEQELGPLYGTLLRDPEDVRFRQEILRDLQQGENRQILAGFSRELCRLDALSRKTLSRLQDGSSGKLLLYGHLLQYSGDYCSCLEGLLAQLPRMGLRSRGLRQASEDLNRLCRSEFYRGLSGTRQQLRRDFDREQYCMLIKNGTVRMKKFQGEPDLSCRVTELFSKFRQEDGGNFHRELPEDPYADHVEEGVLQGLSHLYPDLFQRLARFIEEFCPFADPGLLRFARELRFYLSWLDRIRDMREQGLPFCFPEIGEQSLFCRDFFDPVLADRIGSRVVKNDFYLEDGQRIFVVTGPNQGGKTTFARAMGQLHYLAALGLCVPGTEARLMLPDRVLTHFEREEQGLSGKLEDDLQRLHDLLQQTTGHSVVIVNEIFASTVREDALALGRHMMAALTERGALCVVVTFLDALADFGPGTVSLSGTVDPENPQVRTFRILRRPPDGRAGAMILAQQHGLTYEQILRRIEP